MELLLLFFFLTDCTCANEVKIIHHFLFDYCTSLSLDDSQFSSYFSYNQISDLLSIYFFHIKKEGLVLHKKKTLFNVVSYFGGIFSFYEIFIFEWHSIKRILKYSIHGLVGRRSHWAAFKGNTFPRKDFTEKSAV